MAEGVTVALIPKELVILFDGDDTSLPWSERIQNYADHDNLTLDLAYHLAAIERGEQEVIERQ